MNPEVERVLDIMYEDYISLSGRSGNKKKHPSRKEYGEIITHAKLWGIAAAEALKTGGADDKIPG